MHRKVGLRQIGLACGSVILTLALLEIALNTYLWYFASPDRFNRYASASQLIRRYGEDYYFTQNVRFIPHLYLGHYPTPNFVEGADRHNSLGFRGEDITIEKPEGVFRIVCLGASTTYGDGVASYLDAYPYQLQQYLHEQGFTRVEVINAGVPGYTTWELLINFEFRVLDLDPDLVIVYEGVNDVATRMVWPPSAYRGDNSGSRILDIRPAHPIPLLEYSSLARAIGIRLGITEPHSALQRNFIGAPPTDYRGTFARQLNEETYPSGIFEETSVMTMLDSNPPVYYERNLRNLVALAEANGVDVLVLTFVVSPDFPGATLANSPEYVRGVQEANEVVRLIAQTTAAELLDFVEVMPVDPHYFTDGVHFSVEGNRRWAQVLSDFLVESGLLAEGR